MSPGELGDTYFRFRVSGFGFRVHGSGFRVFALRAPALPSVPGVHARAVNAR